jgi:hypothetical protein
VHLETVLGLKLRRYSGVLGGGSQKLGRDGRSRLAGSILEMVVVARREQARDGRDGLT